MDDREIYIETKLRELEFQFNQINKAMWGVMLGVIIYLQGVLIYPDLFNNNLGKIYGVAGVGLITFVYLIWSGIKGIFQINNDIAEEIESEEYRKKLETSKEEQKLRNRISLFN